LLLSQNQRFTAFAAQWFVVQLVFRDSVFSPAFETTDNQIIQGRMAIAARGTFLKFLVGYAIFCAAVQAADYYIIRHIFTSLIKKDKSYSNVNHNRVEYSF
jgi:hypothetical protein